MSGIPKLLFTIDRVKVFTEEFGILFNEPCCPKPVSIADEVFS